jgi:hypothetical protein
MNEGAAASLPVWDSPQCHKTNVLEAFNRMNASYAFPTSFGEIISVVEKRILV